MAIPLEPREGCLRIRAIIEMSDVSARPKDLAQRPEIVDTPFDVVIGQDRHCEIDRGIGQSGIVVCAQNDLDIAQTFLLDERFQIRDEFCFDLDRIDPAGVPDGFRKPGKDFT